VTEYLAPLRSMTYPGRVIIIGAGPGVGQAMVLYAITGRSPASQARRLRLEARSIWTEPVNEETLKQGNPELLVYRALAFESGIAVSNGRQTEDIVVALNSRGGDAEPLPVLADALQGWKYEPDAPHFTPRISGCVLGSGRAGLSLIRRGGTGGADRAHFSWELEPGRGKLIATYRGIEDNPLPSFAGPPRDLEMPWNSARSMAEAAFEAMAPVGPEKDYRVSVACLRADTGDLSKAEVHIINHRERKDRNGNNG
jgi:phosphoribosylglycinamide formyltransferase 1